MGDMTIQLTAANKPFHFVSIFSFPSGSLYSFSFFFIFELGCKTSETKESDSILDPLYLWCGWPLSLFYVAYRT